MSSEFGTLSDKSACVKRMHDESSECLINRDVSMNLDVLTEKEYPRAACRSHRSYLVQLLFLLLLSPQMASATATYGQKESSDQNFDYMFKILIIGNSSVGKTSFLFRYADDSFTPAFVSTVGIDFKVKTIYRNDKRIKLQIWVRHREKYYISRMEVIKCWLPQGVFNRS